jgi:hypothetical protein
LAIGGLGSLDSRFDELRLIQPTSAAEVDTLQLAAPGAFLGSVGVQPVVLDFPDGRMRVFAVGTELIQAGAVELGYQIQSLPLPPD